MQTMIHDTLNMKEESYMLLVHMAGKESYKELGDSLKKKYDLSNPDAERIFILLQEIENTAKKILKPYMDDVTYYFSGEKDGCGLADIVLLWEHCSDESREECEKRLTGMQEEMYCRLFREHLDQYGSKMVIGEDRENNDTVEDVMKHLLASDLTDTLKLQIQDIFWNRRRHQEKVFGLLKLAEDILMQFEKPLLTEVKFFYDYWMKFCETQDFRSYLFSELNLAMEENSCGCELWAGIMEPNRTMLHCDEEDDQCSRPDWFGMGILFSAGLPFRIALSKDEKNMEEYAPEVLKLLADKSKFEILKYIRDHSAYGSELAKHVNLTTATISHHMNALYEKGLVELEKENNRVFYRTNKKVIREVLDYCSDVLTEER